MASTKEKKIAELVKQLSPEAVEPVKEFLADGIISKQEFQKLAGLLDDVFFELAEDTPDRKRMEKKLREFIMRLNDLNYESEVEDDNLKTAVKLIRQTIIGPSQRDSLARLISAELVESWCTADAGFVEKVAGDDGYIERLTDLADDGPDYGDDELIDVLIGLGGALLERYVSKLSDEDFNSLLGHAGEIAALIDEKKSFGDQLLEAVSDGARMLGIIAMMRRAFTGLLLGDLILRQVGKSLNIKSSMTVTDFIIYVGVKIFETEGVKKAEPEIVKRVRRAIDSAAQI